MKTEQHELDTRILETLRTKKFSRYSEVHQACVKTDNDVQIIGERLHELHMSGAIVNIRYNDGKETLYRIGDAEFDALFS